MLKSCRHMSASPPIQTPAAHRDNDGCPTAWSAWTTAPTATWPDRWSWKVWVMEPGWTRASVGPRRLCPGSSAPSTTLNLSIRAQWTTYTNWTPWGFSQRHHHHHHHHLMTTAWWRSKEAAAHLSKVGTHSARFITSSVIMCTTRYMCGDIFIPLEVCSLFGTVMTSLGRSDIYAEVGDEWFDPSLQFRIKSINTLLMKQLTPLTGLYIWSLRFVGHYTDWKHLQQQRTVCPNNSAGITGVPGVPGGYMPL